MIALTSHIKPIKTDFINFTDKRAYCIDEIYNYNRIKRPKIQKSGYSAPKVCVYEKTEKYLRDMCVREEIANDSFPSFADTYKKIEDLPSNEITIEELLLIIELETSLQQKIKNSSIDEVLYFLFDSIEDILIKSQFKLINIFFERINPNKYNTEILICFLTVSFPWKKVIEKRDRLYKQIQEIIYKKYTKIKAQALLSGLE